MKFRVSILPQARRDIDRNAEWWAAHHSLEQALRWSDAVYDQLEALADFPERHGLSAENGEFAYEIRDKQVGLGRRPSYRAVFTLKDNAAYVLTVRRNAQDLLMPSDIEPPPSLSQ